MILIICIARIERKRAPTPLGGMDATGGPMLKQARELGMKVSVFSFGDDVCTDEMGKLAGAAAEGRTRRGSPRQWPLTGNFHGDTDRQLLADSRHRSTTAFDPKQPSDLGRCLTSICGTPLAGHASSLAPSAYSMACSRVIARPSFHATSNATSSSIAARVAAR